MLWAPAIGWARAPSGVTSCNASITLGPCQAPPSNDRSSCSANRSVSLAISRVLSLLLRVVLRAHEVERDVGTVAHHPTVVRQGGNVEQRSLPELDDTAVLER